MTKTKGVPQLSPLEIFEREHTPVHMIPFPTIAPFYEGERVTYGFVTGSVARSHHQGKVIEFEVMHKGPTMRKCVWWFELTRSSEAMLGNSLPEVPYLGRLLSTDFYSLLTHYATGGLVVDPVYQRPFIWGQHTIDEFFDSVFDGIELGTLTIIRNDHYGVSGLPPTRDLLTLEGIPVSMDRTSRYWEVLDGRQRITSLMGYYLGRIKWRGQGYHDLDLLSKRRFHTRMLAIREFATRDLPTESARIQMFLRINRGVVQDPAHLKTLSTRLEELKNDPRHD